MNKEDKLPDCTCGAPGVAIKHKPKLWEVRCTKNTSIFSACRVAGHPAYTKTQAMENWKTEILRLENNAH